jgi:hypothetical protein
MAEATASLGLSGSSTLARIHEPGTGTVMVANDLKSLHDSTWA